jgi:REP element-mobilizing transposase RayT
VTALGTNSATRVGFIFAVGRAVCPQRLGELARSGCGSLSRFLERVPHTDHRADDDLIFLQKNPASFTRCILPFAPAFGYDISPNQVMADEAAVGKSTGRRPRKPTAQAGEQLSIRYRSWGGARKGAGRKKGPRPPIPHRSREALNPRHPVHVTLHMRRDVPCLRSQVTFGALRRAFRGARERFGMRLVHFNVQGNHLHLIVEAEGGRALSRGMAALGIRIARQLNGVVGRRGGVFAERYHSTPLTCPRQVRNALRYVLLNGSVHRLRVRPGRGGGAGPVGLDPCSSAAVFDGWLPGVSIDALEPWGPACELVVGARLWLLAVGWRRWGAIDPGGSG